MMTKKKRNEKHLVQVILEFPQEWDTEEAAQAFADAWVDHLKTTDRRVRALAEVETHIWTVQKGSGS